MKLKDLTYIDLPPTADMHVHLRDGAMMELVTPYVKRGGCDTVYVMPNLVPPITTVSHALEYHGKLKNLAPDVTFLMVITCMLGGPYSFGQRCETLGLFWCARNVVTLSA